MDYTKKHAEVLAVWQDLFEVCKGLVKRAKTGKEKISASLLKETNAFLRLSLQMMQDGIEEEAERKRIEAAQIDEADLPTFDDDEDDPAPPMSTKMKVDELEF